MAGAFLFGGIYMANHKCKRCVWSNKISTDILMCIFPKCIMKEESKVKVVTEKKTEVVSKAKTSCKGRYLRRSRYVSKKTKKTL
jgi:hypothetical protein